MATALASQPAFVSTARAPRSAQAFKPGAPRIAVSPLQAACNSRCKRGALQIVAVRVKNEEVALGTVAPDFQVSFSRLRNVAPSSDGRAECHRALPPPPLPLAALPATHAAVLICSACNPQLPDVVSGQTIKLSDYAAGAPATLVMFLCVHWCAVAGRQPAAGFPALSFPLPSVELPACAAPPVSAPHCLPSTPSCLPAMPSKPPVPPFLHHPTCRSPFVVHLKASIAALAKEYQAKGVKVLAISSNSIETHPQDGPDKMAEDAQASGYTFPFLYDESQDVAKAYSAACTPEFYVFGSGLELTYHGQYDSSRPSKYGGDTPVTGEDLRHALDCTLAGKLLERPVRNSIGCNIKWHPGRSPAWFHG
ncbi:hypothetical protein ABPG75_005557 [Micractinium tetrahymenae]